MTACSIALRAEMLCDDPDVALINSFMIRDIVTIGKDCAGMMVSMTTVMIFFPSSFVMNPSSVRYQVN